MSREQYIGSVAADVLTKIPEVFDLVIVRKEFEKIEKNRARDEAAAEGESARENKPAVGAVLLPPTTIVLLQVFAPPFFPSASSASSPSPSFSLTKLLLTNNSTKNKH